MLFEPYKDELEYIERIHKYNEKEYTIIRLTDTMLKKNIIDANVFVQDILYKYGVMDFSQLKNGDKKMLPSDLYVGNDEFKTTMSCYRAKTRGDERFWIYGSDFKKNFLSGDLIYITVNQKNDRVIIINISKEILTDDFLIRLFGQDRIDDSLSRLVPKIKRISSLGYHPNSKGKGEIAPKDAGETLEFLLGLKTNNNPEADFEGLIELKSKTAKTLDTLFTLRPKFEGTPVAELEPNDRNRVSAFARLYGYESDKHPGMNSLYITIGTESAPQNNQGFYLEVNEKERTVEIRKRQQNSSHKAAFWNFEDLEKELHQKHPATLWVKAESRMNGELAEFRYTEVELTRSPQFMTFISLIKLGVVTYDWRGYISKGGKYEGKNHGNAWRIKNTHRNQLFGSSQVIELV
ncbi:hypothetical protein D8811_02230 [Streptococcus gordonii]|jgi:putative endonuclease|uniref:MvaI/BcnI family restriction endonuclease n=1 Tax=Streptococcus gordonii TaxID=1302 RepID=UPI000F6597DC|nr:MvaI/BcnI family restriction endonuclease [Streptococcus gordonii]MBX9097180.1 restriction endonuclease [Streptococcus gordonii]RSJ58316.1 hypothetical protein D8811_02230 [Streptococcus gordonii]